MNTFILLLLFIAVIAQLLLLIILFARRRGTAKLCVNCALFAAGFTLLTVFTDKSRNPGAFGGERYPLVFAAALLMLAHTSAVLFAEARRRRAELSDSSVKEEFDNLPSGVCFFNANGIPLLCNRAMHRIVFGLTGRDLQHVSDLTAALEKLPSPSGEGTGGALCLLPDGTSWQFSPPTQIDGCTQYTASDVTELCEKKKEAERDMEELKAVSRSLKRYANSVQDAVREQEILAVKMRIHEEIGSSLTAVGRVLAENLPLSEAEPVIEKWRSGVWTLRRDNEDADKTDCLQQLRTLCADMKLELITSGELPKEGGAGYLLVTAMRVCATNAVRHAGATELRAELSADGETARVVITNNGRPPEKEIAEGGGLGNLRRRIEGVGGRMAVRSLPRFELTAEVPLAKEAYL